MRFSPAALPSLAGKASEQLLKLQLHPGACFSGAWCFDIHNRSAEQETVVNHGRRTERCDALVRCNL